MSRSKWSPAYIGVGSNLDGPREHVAQGLSELGALEKTKLIAVSKFYRTAPVGPQDQPHYVNAVAGLLTQQNALELLLSLKSLEKKLGRDEPVVRWGPRVIDFDLLALGSERIDSETLKVPHPGIPQRAFVLVPWSEVAPHFSIPGMGNVSSLCARVDASGVEAM
jgi:2-amino-4-hydroxy-6-hydroxymethyldihydropteridine diphosphokinase